MNNDNTVAPLGGADAQQVTFDVSGTYPDNFAASKLTAPNASFLIEFTVKQTVPATPPNSPLYFQTPLVNASYSFEGFTHPAPPTSSFTRSDSAGNLEAISLTFQTGTFVLSSNPPSHDPLLSERSGSNGRFVLGDLGASQAWHVQYTPNGAPSVNNRVNVSEFVSRLASA
ncbi:MAG TPA: hypothetical protein VGD78_18395 [Chthoniobacterales bacterium]